MSKKFFFIGTLALLGAALVVLLGCPTEAEAGPTGLAGSDGSKAPNIFNGSPSVQAIQAAVILDGVTIKGEGTLDFKNASVTVYGTLASSSSDSEPLYIIAKTANLTFAEGAEIAPGTEDYFFGTAEQVEKKAAAATNVIEAVAETALESFTGSVTAVENLELSYKTGDGGSAPDWYSNTSLAVYVFGKLTVTGNADAPTGAAVTAINKVEVKPESDDTIETLASDKIDVTGTDIAVANTGAVTLTLPATAAVKSLAGGTGDLTIGGAATSLALGSLKSNVTIPDTILAVTIDGGAGSVTFSLTDEKTLTTAIFKNAGTTAFTGAFTVTLPDSASFGGAVSFQDEAVIGGTTFGGNVTVTDGKAITLTDSKAVTLAKDVSIIISGNSLTTVLTATTGAVLTAGGAATLTPSESGGSLTLDAHPLVLTSGTLTVAIGATLDVGTQTLTVKKILDAQGTVTVGGTTNSVTLTKAKVTGDATTGTTLAGASSGKVTLAEGNELAIAETGTVALAGTGSVVLPSAADPTGNHSKLSGAGKLTAAQDLEISGEWIPVPSGSNAQTVTIASTADTGQASITGSTLSSETVSLADGTGATITQKAGTENNELTLTTVTLNLSAAGSLVLKGASENGAMVSLTADTAIIKGGGKTGTVASLTEIGGVTVSSSLTIDTNTVFEDDGTGNPFYIITGGSSSAGSITAKETGTDLTLDKTTTLTYTG